MSSKVIIGSRGSDLALWQANFTKEILEAKGHQVEIQIIKTQGDIIQHLSFDKMEGKGFFTKEIEEHLLDCKIDLAVHSHKDLPTTNPPGLMIGAVSYRENCTETLLIRPEAFDPYSKFKLKPGAVVGTSSHRRKSQLLHHRPDLITKDLRGNVPTRIDKLINQNYDAIVLASAGLKRLNLKPAGVHLVELSEIEFIPAPAQGVLAYQIREGDERMHTIVEELHHEDVFRSISIERGVLNKLDGGCQLPLGVYCKEDEKGFHTWTSLQPLDGKPYRRFYHFSEKNASLVNDLISRVERKEGRTVYISREPENASLFMRQTQSFGFQAIAQATLVTEEIEVNHMPFTDWVFFSSRNCVKSFFEQGLMLPDVASVAALGSGTAEELKYYGVTASFVGNDGEVDKTAKAFLEQVKGKSVLFPIGEQSHRTVQLALKDEVECHEILIYRQVANPDFVEKTADIFVFTSPALFEAYTNKELLKDKHLVCIGETTKKAIQSAGFQNITMAYQTNEQALADTVCGLL